MVIPTPIPATTSNDRNSKDSHRPTSEKPKDDDDEEDITASFTIIAPSAANRSRPSSLIVTAKTSTFAEEKPQEEVSATFVMMTQRKESRTPTPTSRTHTPTENVETTIVITPSSKRLVEASITDDDKGKQQEEESSSSSSSSAADDDDVDEVEDDTSSGKADGSRDDQEQDENKTDKKTEPPPLETITPTSMPVSNTSTTTTSKERSPTSQRAQSTERMRAAFFSPLSLTPATTAATTTTATTPTLESPVRLRDKRSLFDLDNASSHAMADRIRHETNRYGFDEKRAGNLLTGELSTIATAQTSSAASSSYMPSSVHESSTDRDSSMSPLFGNLGPISGMGYNYTAASRRSLDSSSASLPNSPLHSRERDRESGANEATTGNSTTSSNISAADRRPSWRLKFDAGSKVIHPYTNNIAKQETYTKKIHPDPL